MTRKMKGRRKNNPRYSNGKNCGPRDKKNRGHNGGSVNKILGRDNISRTTTLKLVSCREHEGRKCDVDANLLEKKTLTQKKSRGQF